MILRNILKREREKERRDLSVKHQAVDNFKKDLTGIGFSYTKYTTHLLQMQLRTGGN
jgi:uncharacterized protein YdhG (YjbR/CyaY superfamily)